MENLDNKRFKVIQFEEQYFEELKDLVRIGWNPNHVLLQSDELFRWHYTGFGQKAGMSFPLLFDGDKMIGYRMMTPIEMALPDNDGNHKVIPLSASSLYYVDEKYRGMGLGVKLEQCVIEYYGGYFTIAANPVTAVPILKRSGCKMIDSMLRYFRPLSDDISPLITADCDYDRKPIESEVIAPCHMDAGDMADIWSKSIEGKRVTALNRSESFWQWRYIDDPIYKYYFFHNHYGLVVARICDIYNEHKKKTHNKVLRILEVIPTDQNVWDGVACAGLSTLIDGVCGWGKSQGCLAAEFYTSTHRFAPVMVNAFFEEINMIKPLCDSIMSYFEPESKSHRLCNVGIMSSLVPDDFDFENSYFTLSDADQDRPNII